MKIKATGESKLNNSLGLNTFFLEPDYNLYTAKQLCYHRIKLCLFFVAFSPLVTGGYSFIIKEVPGNFASQVFSIVLDKNWTCACSVSNEVEYCLDFTLIN